ncbi:hypothetical protein FocnCong_v009496 [Fusarium oxysporum f. sp. conglutinans]|nr:hypothetical protein FocnCong_v009496 [Fusarium oxysporum f. sp. conglutinans]
MVENPGRKVRMLGGEGEVATAGAGLDVVGGGTEGNYNTRDDKPRSPSRYDSLAKANPVFRPIQPKQSSVEEISRREQAEAVARLLPKRRRRGGRLPKRRPDTSGASNTGGSGQYPVLTRVQHDAAAGSADASLSGQSLQPRVVGGSSRVAVAEPVLFHRHVLPKESRRGDEDGDGMAAVVQRKRRGGRPVTRIMLRTEDVHQRPTRPIQPREKEGIAGDAHLVGWSSPRLPHQTACEEADQPRRDDATDPRQLGWQGKRTGHPGGDQPLRKQIRAGMRGQRRRDLQAEDLASVLTFLEEEFAVKERLSNEQTWCAPIPHERKVSTVQGFYKAFHDANALPIWTCTLCYRKRTKSELREITWNEWVSSCVEKGSRSPFSCHRCFPVGEAISGCVECVRGLRRGALSPAAQLHRRIGCEHMFPDELKDLTPVEEKLIAMNSCYGFVTRYSIPSSQKQTAKYPKHIKGHITVFPNNVQELATKVLPHPLVQVMEEIHVSWQGAEKPAPSDLSGLLSVRRRVVERALVWLRKNNPHYAEIEIDVAEMESWGAPPHGVPSAVYDCMERNEPTAWEKTRTAQVVPPTERGIDEEGLVEIEEILASLNQGQDIPNGGIELLGPNEDEGRDQGESESEKLGKPINEVTSSGMFALDAAPDVADVEKLLFACNVVNGDAAGNANTGPRTELGSVERRRRHVDACEPYIHVSRGDDFADSFDASFFAKTFPTLLPFGVGGPRLVEEAILGAEGDADKHGVETAAQDLISSRNMSLRAWADVVLRRHGGRFATHHIFAFLVFNMSVRSKNRRVSMLSVTRKNFRKAEGIIQSLSAERLAAARVGLESSGKTTDEAVKELLRSLSLYGFRQPMSRESRLSMRRKIQSLILRYGVPAIWFTLNPNDITNPVKLRLAAYRTPCAAGHLGPHELCHLLPPRDDVIL